MAAARSSISHRSTATNRAMPATLHNCAILSGSVALSKTAAFDYAQRGIRINVVSPGYTHSEMVDPFVESAPELTGALVNRHSGMNRPGNAEETAEAIA
ncbi:MAG: SDR family oxidoreductase [Acidobacteria bacterium]|nr:SDR family oxidoreductase [Acidobacteriota bacterium]